MKKLKYLLFILAFTSVSSMINAQTKKTKTNKTTKPEIDRLAEKYKDNPAITIYTSYANLIGNITINYNIDNKPESIDMDIKSDSRNAVEEFVENIVSQKLKQGYKIPIDGKLDSGSELLNYFRSIDLEQGETFDFILRKGNLIFKISGGRDRKLSTFQSKTMENLSEAVKELYINELISSHSMTELDNSYSIYITTIDYSRKGGKKATKLDF
jgi:hypothetical protein